MTIPNLHYADLKDSYLFHDIGERVSRYQKEHPGIKIYRMGVGDVTLPLCDAVIKAMHDAVDEQADISTFHGYMPECGLPSFREKASLHYASRGTEISPDEVFVSPGASDDLGAIMDLFDCRNSVLVMEPAYPAYVDTNIMIGRRIVHMPAGEFNGFTPLPDPSLRTELIYICSPNNPTGAVFDRDQLKKWVDFANENGSVIIFDAAYEAYIEDPSVPHSIYEIDGAKDCAIEICSFSKTAGFTGTRLGYTIIPKELKRYGMDLNAMWVRNRTTKSNGVSYIIQKSGEAVFTEEGQRQINENIRYYKENGRSFMKVLDDLGVRYYGGKNAPYIWMKCPGELNSWDFFDLLLNEIQVIGTPGVGFGSCGEGFIRFSTFANNSDTAEAAERISSLLRRL